MSDTTRAAPGKNPHFERIDRAPYELGHLLKKMPADFSMFNPITADDRLIAEAAMNHATNANDILMNGLAALGNVMFVAGANGNSKVNSDDIADIGCLIRHIAVEAQFLQETEWSIREALEAHIDRAAPEVAKSKGHK